MSKNPTRAKRAVTKIADAVSEIVQSPEKKRRSLPEATSPKTPTANSEDEGVSGKKGKANERSLFPRDKIDPLPLVDGQKYLRVMSWNVNGLKALVTNNLSVLHNLVNKHKPDILCLQETKIQEQMVDEYKDLLPDYCSYWNCCTVKKGYSGTAFFVNRNTIGVNIQPTTATTTKKVDEAPKKKQTKLSSFLKPVVSNPVAEESASMPAIPTNSSATPKDIILERISYDFEDEGAFLPGEGRTITLELNKFIVVGCYVPNSGEGLVRLDYRVKEWDPHMSDYLTTLSKRKPVIFTGDLNVGHLDVDIHNPTAKHIVKQAGLTPVERDSFTQLLSTNLRDAFRYFYPNAMGQFSYWSQRTFARRTNHGIRLDYFICSEDLFPPKQQQQSAKAEIEEASASTMTETTQRVDVIVEKTPIPGIVDSYILPEDTIGCSDHCPVMLVMKL